MDTKTFEQFDMMSDVQLSTVEGGGWRCAAGAGGGALTGLAAAGIGILAASNPVGWVVGGVIVGSATAGGGLTGAATFC
ncbi:Blp family class II bacteriocin [Streptococcus saliviloxodontae]|uniref:Bacteriocin n=1 Tax=Streptococcus saliviloxodontae TaxID=1349416 RepID=A0ABS2PJD9_9STRE|nr:Blp family class II bacteriocin [Streptococcus saliviloxodontae]MBM7635543.1 hypothetical protein [Streptococcus saliviloxodontae]